MVTTNREQARGGSADRAQLGGATRRGPARQRARLARAAFAVVCLLSASAAAQSAADIATARQLATQGIRLYDKGEYVQALDDLQRAQALFDAPVHLLYIARAQVKLGKLVEGSETYRRLARTTLEPNAPQAFRDAVEAAQRELPELEAKLPSVRVEAAPADAPGLRLFIDQEEVPAAALGVDRPINPGEHRIRVEATGYEPAETSLSVRPGEKKPVLLTLTPAAPGTTAGSASPTTAGRAARLPAPTVSDQGAEPRQTWGFVAGLKVGGAVATGQFYKDLPMSDAVQGIGGFGLYGGLRFAKYFSGLLLLDVAAAKPGELFDLSLAAGERRVDNTATLVDFGLAGRVGTPRGAFGGFGELALLPVHSLQVYSDRQRRSDTCEATYEYDGSAIRLGGGAFLPLGSAFQVVPTISWTIGQFGEAQSSRRGGVCPDLRAPGENLDSATHSVFFFGVAGEFLFGKDNPAK